MRRLITSLRIFVSGAWLSYIALFHWTHPASYIASKIVMPIASMLFFYTWGCQPLDMIQLSSIL